MKQDDLRQALIDGTIHVIAQNGLDKATTKAISNATGINEVYIYRLFKNKENLFKKAFEHLDKQLLDKCLLHIDVMYMGEMDYETRCRIYFLAMWRFLVGNKDEILMYRTDYVDKKLGENWVKHTDGYFYYAKVLAVNETTDALFDQIVIPTDVTNGDAATEYKLDVKAYAVQAQGAKPSWSAVQTMSVEEIAGWFNTCGIK